MSRIAGRFSRYEPRPRTGRLVLSLLSDLPRENCWTIAEWAGEAGPHGMQHLPCRPPGMPTPSATGWVTEDEGCGGNPKLRAALEERGIGYVLAVACSAEMATGAGALMISPG